MSLIGLHKGEVSTSPNPWQGVEYDVLVAAHLLRNPQFLSKNADLLEHAAEAFFGHFALPDIVKVGLAAWRRTGTLPPAPAILDALQKENPQGGAASLQTYQMYVDRIFSIPLEGEANVQETLVPAVQRRLLARLDEQKDELLSEGKEQEYFKIVRAIEALGLRDGAELSSVDEDLDSLLYRSAHGLATGFTPLDRCLDRGGICPGELLLVIGDPNVGKTQFLHHLARQAIKQGARTLVLSLETSHRNTRMRLLRGLTGWTREQVERDPEKFKEAVAQHQPLPLHVCYAPAGGLYNIPSLATDIDRVEQKTGDKVQFVVRDYGELMAAELGSWQEIRKTYMQFKALLGKLKIPGADACQRNRRREISNFDLLKDADIGVAIEEDHPGSNLLLAEIVRIREGGKGTFALVADRPTGRLRLQQMSPVVDNPDNLEYNGKPS